VSFLYKMVIWYQTDYKSITWCPVFLVGLVIDDEKELESMATREDATIELRS
jgi:hypothetical protein